MALDKNKVTTKPADSAAPTLEVPDTTAKAAAEVAATVTYDPETVGINSDKIAFVANLSDPSNSDPNEVTLSDGTKTTIDNGTIVGYRIKALADGLQIPNFGTTDNLKSDKMNFSELKYETSVAGKDYDLTLAETGALLADPTIAGRFSGGDGPSVHGVYLNGARKNGDQVAKTTAVPTVSLRIDPAQDVKSLKNLPFVPVLEFTRTPAEGGGRPGRHIRKALPNFEKWAPLSAAAAPRASTGGASSVRDAKKVQHEAVVKGQGFLAALERAQKNRAAAAAK